MIVLESLKGGGAWPHGPPGSAYVNMETATLGVHQYILSTPFVGALEAYKENESSQ